MVTDQHYLQILLHKGPDIQLTPRYVGESIENGDIRLRAVQSNDVSSAFGRLANL